MSIKTSEKHIHILESGNTLLEPLESGVVFPLLVTGSSMLPFLKHKRDTVWLVKSTEYRHGQILLFRRINGTFVLHRIRKIFPDGSMLVNGDAQSWCETVSPEQAVAVVCAVTVRGKKRDCSSLFMRCRDALWYPTRPVRPVLFRIYSSLHRILPSSGGNE